MGAVMGAVMGRDSGCGREGWSAKVRVAASSFGWR